MSPAYIWIERVVLTIHDEQLAEHGGDSGLRDAGLLDSVLAKPQQLANSGEPSVFDLAAAYAFGVACNHPFIDGNKRTAWMLARLFLELHGHTHVGSDLDTVVTMLKVAAGEIAQDEFAAWLRQNAAATQP